MSLVLRIGRGDGDAVSQTVIRPSPPPLKVCSPVGRERQRKDPRLMTVHQGNPLAVGHVEPLNHRTLQPTEQKTADGLEATAHHGDSSVGHWEAT